MKLFDSVHPAFPLPTTASPNLHGTLNKGFGKAVVTSDMPELCEPPSPDRCQKWFLWIHQKVDLAPIPVVGLVLQVRDAKKFLQVLSFENLDRFLRVNKHGPCLTCTAIEEDGGNKRAVIVTKLMALVSSSMIQHGNISRVSPMTLCCVVAFPCLNAVVACMKISAFPCANKSPI